MLVTPEPLNPKISTHFGSALESLGHEKAWLQLLRIGVCWRWFLAVLLRLRGILSARVKGVQAPLFDFDFL